MLPSLVMATKRPALRPLPGPDQVRGRQLHREVSAIVQRHLDDACARAWAEVAERYATHQLFTEGDPSAVSAQQATHALSTLLAQGLSRLMVAAVVLPPRGKSRDRRWTASRPNLAAVPGGLGRNGHTRRYGHAGRNGHATDDWRPSDPSSSR